jgi:hypothetical protein
VIDFLALRTVLESRDFTRLVLGELARNGGGVKAGIEIATVSLIRQRVPRDRAELLALAYVIGAIRGINVMAAKEAREEASG